MKPDSERKKFYEAKLHKKKSFVHVHVGKELAKKLAKKRRAVLVHHGDEVKVLRGSAKGKVGHIVRVNYNKGKVYVEGITKRTARGKEVLIAIHPSNLVLLDLQKTPERESLFKEELKEKKVETKEKIVASEVVRVEEKTPEVKG